MSQTDMLPVSPAEKQLWLQWALMPNNPWYNLVAAIQLDGPVVAEALETACQQVVGRHESLHSSFVEVDGKLYRQLRPEREASFDILDASGVAGESSHQRLLQRVRTIESRPFNLAADCLLRFLLARLAGDKHILVLVLHHIVADARSLEVILGDIAEAYGQTTGETTTVTQITKAQITDYIAAMGEELDTASESLLYWKELVGNTPPFALPSDYSPLSRQHRGDRMVQGLGSATWANTLRVTQASQTSVFSVLAAVFMSSLYRLCERRAVLVGTNVSCRMTPETIDTVGLCINMLPLLVEFIEGTSLCDLARKIHRSNLAGVRHRRVPLSAILEDQRANRRSGFEPLLPVVFNFYERRSNPFESKTVKGRYLQFPTHFSRFDIACTIVAEQETLSLQITYDSDLYARETMESLAALIEHTAGRLLAAPDAAIEEALRTPGTLSYVPAKVSASLLPPQEYPETILAGFDAVAQTHPDTVAVADSAGDLTYRELSLLSTRLANRLGTMGVTSGHVVPLLFEPSKETIVALLAVLKAGAAYAPVDPRWPVNRIRDTIELVAAPLLITNCLNHPVHNTVSCPCISVESALVEPASTRCSPPHISSHTLAYVLCTSGSTGTPKAVAVEHEQVIAYVKGVSTSLRLETMKYWPVVCTYSADITVTCIYGCLINGGTLLMLGKSDSLDAFRIAAWKQRFPAHYLKLAPSHLSALLHQDPSGSFLPDDMVIIGGELLTWDLVERIRKVAPGLRIANHYSPCETTCGILTNDVTSQTPSTRNAGVPMGTPIPGVCITISDRFGITLPPCLPGEVAISGRTVSRGYLGSPEETARKFVELPGASDHVGRVYLSGDIARLNPSGAIEFLCRRDCQVKVRGFRVELTEVERAIEQQPAIAQAAVTPFGERASSRGLIALLRLHHGEGIDLHELRKQIGALLPDHMIPEHFMFVNDLPLNHNGKLDRSKLAEHAQEFFSELRQAEQPAEPTIPGATGIRQLVRNSWQNALGTDKFGDQDKFFEVGGNSLKLMQVYAALRADIGACLSIADLFRRNTVDELVSFLGEPTEF